MRRRCGRSPNGPGSRRAHRPPQRLSGGVARTRACRGRHPCGRAAWRRVRKLSAGPRAASALEATKRARSAHSPPLQRWLSAHSSRDWSSAIQSLRAGQNDIGEPNIAPAPLRGHIRACSVRPSGDSTTGVPRPHAPAHAPRRIPAWQPCPHMPRQQQRGSPRRAGVRDRDPCASMRRRRAGPGW